MNPSPYLLRFSGLASQLWMCPSTTKYFSPSFSYKATYPFPYIAMRFGPRSLPAHRPLFTLPVSKLERRHTLAWFEDSPVLWPHLLPGSGAGRRCNLLATLILPHLLACRCFAHRLPFNTASRSRSARV